MPLRRYFLRLQTRPLVRPWALAGPILVLILCLPLLRPLRHPELQQASDAELSTLATIQAVAEQGTLAIDDSSFAHTHQKIRSPYTGHYYSSQPPVQGVLLAGCYWVMNALGLSFARNAILVSYLLTLIGVTVPVAFAAGLVYRMGRLFELPRVWRALLGVVTVLGSGLVSYSVVLNPHAPAAAAILAAVACLAYIAICQDPLRSGGWLAAAGLFAALAAVVDLSAVVFLPLLALVVLAMRWPAALRVGGVLLYLIGATPPLLLHAVLVMPITGDLLPGAMHPELAVAALAPGPDATVVPATYPEPDFADAGAWDADDSAAAGDAADWDSTWSRIGYGTGRIVTALLGAHGLLSHFPILIVSFLGIGAVLHRHWPAATKMLAVATLAGSGLIFVRAAFCRQTSADGAQAMFAARWGILFLPLLLFWAGAWLRRWQQHHPLSWSVVGALCAFSIAVSLIGATGPCPPEGFRGYTPVAALRRLMPSPPPPASPTTQLAHQGE